MPDDPIVQANNVPAHVYNKLSPFLKKLYCILNGTPTTPAQTSIIGWSPSGTSFTIYSIPLLEEQVLGQWFKTRTYNSFARQLNIYHFSKSTHPQAGSIQGGKGKEMGWEKWSCEWFERDKPERALVIKRKNGEKDKPTTTQLPPPPTLPDNLLTIESSPDTQQQAPLDTSSLLLTSPQHNAQGGVYLNPHALLALISTMKQNQDSLLSEFAQLRDRNELLWKENMLYAQRNHSQQDKLNRIYGIFEGFLKRAKLRFRDDGQGGARVEEDLTGFFGSDDHQQQSPARKGSNRLMIEGPPTAPSDPEDAPSPASTISDGHRFVSLDTPITDEPSPDVHEQSPSTPTPSTLQTVLSTPDKFASLISNLTPAQLDAALKLLTDLSRAPPASHSAGGREVGLRPSTPSLPQFTSLPSDNSTNSGHWDANAAPSTSTSVDGFGSTNSPSGAPDWLTALISSGALSNLPPLQSTTSSSEPTAPRTRVEEAPVAGPSRFSGSYTDPASTSSNADPPMTLQQMLTSMDPPQATSSWPSMAGSGWPMITNGEAVAQPTPPTVADLTAPIAFPSTTSTDDPLAAFSIPTGDYDFSSLLANPDLNPHLSSTLGSESGLGFSNPSDDVDMTSFLVDMPPTPPATTVPPTLTTSEPTPPASIPLPSAAAPEPAASPPAPTPTTRNTRKRKSDVTAEDLRSSVEDGTGAGLERQVSKKRKGASNRAV